jgi:hypothetical protein
MATSKRKFVDSTPSHPAGDGKHFVSSRSGVQPACAPDQPDEVDSAFEKLESGAPPPGIASTDTWQDGLTLLENAALLRAMASGHRGMLRDRMLELAAGSPYKRWLVTVRLLLRSLLKAAEALDEAALLLALASFDLLLERASRMQCVVLDETTRRALLAGYARLSPGLAHAFEPPICA